MKYSRHFTVARHRRAGLLPLALLLLLLSATCAYAQSQDLGFPTPASTNEIGGQIAARDIGDARLTRHYYILAGTPGDLTFTVTSHNLNGDVDLFTAGSMRPLGKISLYAGSRPTTATKTVFLRQHESLILRVEARSANDNEGTYNVRFGGTFEPVMTAPTPPEESAATTPSVSARTDRSVRRVTSSGARIDEPEPEPTATNTQTTTTETATSTEPSTTPTTATTTETTQPVEPAPRTEPARTARTRRPRGRRSSSRTTTPAPQPQPSDSSTESTSTASASPAPTTLNPRLIIETRDGMRQERFMSTVRSVTVQNGQIVIVSSKGGKVERISLASILKMSIEP